jgi:hypothetical protein
MIKRMTATSTTARDHTPTLRFDQLVAGQTVHRSNLSDVLITDAQPMGQDRFLAGAHWPRNHVLLGRTKAVDPALVAETIRQVTIYSAHAFYGVALDAQFLMLHLTAEGCSRPARRVGPRVVLEVTFTETRHTGGSLVEFEVRVTCSDEVGVVATGSASGRIVGRRVYERSRGVAVTSPAVFHPAAAALEVTSTDPVTGLLRLVVDPDEPAFFDHPLDHVPGMLMLEAARQSVRAVCGAAEVVSFDARFLAITELGEPCHLRVTDTDRGWRVAFEQDGRLTAEIICRPGTAAPAEADRATGDSSAHAGC